MVPTRVSAAVTRQAHAAASDLKVGDNAVALGRPGTDTNAARFTAGIIEDRGSLPVDIPTFP